MRDDRSATPELFRLSDMIEQGAPDLADGSLWRLPGDPRRLDATLHRLPPAQALDERTDAGSDALLIVLEGDGHLVTTDGAAPRKLRSVSAAWLPPGLGYRLRAGARGLACVRVCARPGDPAPPRAAAVRDEGGEPACMLALVCPECGRMAPGSDARFCWRCGSPLPDH
ncbi:hypothetical protein [Streptomyces sp. NPDC003077]|uniref:hypothetical protein n=1 Tax=Streptomyces sp. NPDC003077 TaxID=3154443 RepID=UPI00339EAD0E